MMKRYVPLCMAIVTVFSLYFAACDTLSSDGIASAGNLGVINDVYDYSGMERFTAKAMNEANSYYDTTVVKVETGTHCDIWLETALSNIKKSDVQALMRKFDNEIYPTITQAFGNYEDLLGGNTKLVLLILDIKDSYNGNNGYIAGYFNPEDLYNTNNSNSGAILYIDANPQRLDGTEIYRTIAHELQHLINYAYYLSKQRSKPQDTWVNEGLSSAAEYLCMRTHSTSRISWFNEDKLGTIAQGNNFYVWETASSNEVLDDYATVYLFFQWLRIHSPDGERIYKDICQSSSTDYRAVTGAAASRLGMSDWNNLFSTWLAANYQNDPTGLKGYRGEIKTHVWAVGSGAYSLLPGEAIYTKSSSPGTSTNTNIKFGILTRNSTNTGPNEYRYADNDTTRVVMYNANTNNLSSSIRVTFTDGTKEDKPAKSSSARSAAVVSGSYPVDAWAVWGWENQFRQESLPGEVINVTPFTPRQ